jgi:nucleoside-diphosphate-sugar epimerase
MKYFITGATGFIGGEVVRQLLADDHEVVALVRDKRRARALEEQGVLLAEGDIRERSSLTEPMKGADGVFHMAAWYQIGAKDRIRMEEINVRGTQNVLEVMRELGIKKGVYTSTLAVYSDTKGEIVDESYFYSGRHLNAYDRSKWKAHYEAALPMMEKGLPLVIVLPGLVYGPGDTSLAAYGLKQYIKGKLFMVPKKAAFCWSHVEDTARGHLLAMEKGKSGESYIIAGDPYTLIEAYNLASGITGIKAPRRRVGPAVLKLASVGMRFFGMFFRVPDAYTAGGLKVLAGATYLASSAKARHELGFRARPLEEGLRDTLAEMLAESPAACGTKAS